MSKLKYEEGDRVIVNELANTGGEYDHIGEIGMITEIEYKPQNPDDCFPPPYRVDFGNREIESYWEYELNEFP